MAFRITVVYAPHPCIGTMSFKLQLFYARYPCIFVPKNTECYRDVNLILFSPCIWTMRALYSKWLCFVYRSPVHNWTVQFRCTEVAPVMFNGDVPSVRIEHTPLVALMGWVTSYSFDVLWILPGRFGTLPLRVIQLLYFHTLLLVRWVCCIWWALEIAALPAGYSCLPECSLCGIIGPSVWSCADESD